MSTEVKKRIAITLLTLSGGAFTALIAHEGFSERAIIPVPGDVPTLGHGSTTHADGTPVKMGDTTTRQAAAVRTRIDVAKFEGALKTCVKVPLHQHEFDAFISLQYNIGTRAFCTSTLVRRLNAGDYAGACEAILMWDKFKGRALPGLTKRRREEHRRCIGP